MTEPCRQRELEKPHCFRNEAQADRQVVHENRSPVLEDQRVPTGVIPIRQLHENRTDLAGVGQVVLLTNGPGKIGNLLSILLMEP